MSTLFPDLYGLEPDELRDIDMTLPYREDEEGTTS
jgi:hypothetical protein